MLYGEGGRRLWLLEGRRVAVLFWDFPQDEYTEWVASGCGTESWAAYQRRRANQKNYAASMGYKFIAVEMPVAAMLRRLAEKQKANTGEHRHLILGIVTDENEGRGQTIRAQGPNE